MTSAEPTGVRARVAGVLASWERWLPWALLAVALTYPFWFDLWPFSYVTLDALGLKLDVVIFMIVYVMLALGLNVVVGFAGLLDLGYVAFFALGAYTVGWFASDKFSGTEFHFLSNATEGAHGIHLNMWLILLLGGVITAIAGVIIGWPTLRLRGDYLAIVTLGFGEIIPDVFRNADKLPVPGGVQGSPPFIDFTNVNLTNGVRGVRSLDRPGFGENLDSLTAGVFPERFSGIELKPWYFTIVFMVLVTVFVIRRLERSKMGRAWVAVREDEIAASAMGVPLMRTKTWSYAIGAFFGGIAGAFFASYRAGAFPADFYFNISIFLLCMVILGGMGSIWGVFVGGMILGYLNIHGLAVTGSKIQDAGIDFDPNKYQFGIYGVIIVVMMLFRPVGLIPERRHKIELEEGVHDTPFYDVQTEGALTDRDPSDD